MNFKQILSIVVVISLVLLVSYLLAQKGVKSGQVCPTSAPKQVASLVQEETKEAQPKVTFIELGSVGCGPCDMMRPILDEIEKEYEGQAIVRFYDVKSLLGGPYAEKYRIQLIPTQVFLDKDGNEYYRHVGFFPKDEIVKILKLKGVK
jgi:thioredoxin 1